ncbi:putative DEAD-box ATP-dependent RNA helicase [Microbacterium hydrocarbonoxydans]|uniref:Putative DEAD-box ATP-dependent RNA helicase n=1 Tax=Microbacterium hydrocarbonoxydans TaxID=273678 RepID=A0A0M2HVR8_9MICO|nr:DEAD/DEAH box helicase [Microbacterium hydrocarbonoxydans]KJL48548.1 putative DEAD-box ATP-dependent RNA helicase [Microbacterium hydrocarbonoxydans]
MPKNKKPRGGRPAANFEPRYGAKKTSFHDRHAGAREGARPERGGFRADAGERRSAPAAGGYDRRPGSRSAGHRGYRPAEAETGAPKQRWSAQERAGRDEARSIRNRAESGRRETPHHRDERPRFDERSERPRYNDRPTAGRRFDDRPRRDDRGAERPRFERDGQRPTGPGTYRDDRGAERPRFNRDERPQRDDRGFADRGDRAGARNERPRFDRGAERPRFNRDERPQRDDRAERPRFNDRGAERRRFDRDERPRRDDRGSDRARFNDASSAERPARSYDADRARRAFDRDRAQRSIEGGRDERSRPSTGGAYRTERPRRDDRTGGDSRPSRNDWNAKPKAAFEPTDDVVHERLEAKSVAAVEVDGVSFADLGLGSNIVETLANMGAASPFAIQAASIPAVLSGRDVLARGRTGSGKTIAFGAPLVENVLKSQAGKRREFGRSPRAIILAPTRELALQIDRTIQPIARSVGLFTTQIYGGVPQGRQVGALKKGVDIVIGTPGRVEDLINQGKLDLSDCRIAVLDEADHMCELGFVEPVQRILRHTADGSQKLLFSATLDREVAALVDEFLVDPAVYEVAGEDQDSSTIEHRVLVIEHRDKADILTSLVDREGKTLVFARTRAYADMLAEQFDDAGIPAVSLHGDLNQAKRTRNLERLTSGRVNVLVATDVAARGIHVDDIDLVVQADAPDEYKTYLHRSGRTGRAGRSGRVVTLITRQRQRRMTELLQRAEIDAPFENARLDDDLIEEIAGRVPTAADLTA